MANSAQARKRARQANKHYQHNTAQRSNFRTFLKKVVKSIAIGNKEQAEAAYKAAVPVIDKMVSKGLIHKNKAARHKSRLNARVFSMQAS